MYFLMLTFQAELIATPALSHKRTLCDSVLLCFRWIQLLSSSSLRWRLPCCR